MALKSGRSGKITTFFSYKGGVGRTMAVANVGFIAALAGKRVLLMDWDLEAPGLAVYFRGITEHEAAVDIRKAPGVLDLFTEWRDGLLVAQNPSSVTAMFKRFSSGAPFGACACPLLPANRLPKGAKLDMIGAGAAMIGQKDPYPYAEALSRFHWPSFFAEFAGGAMLEALRNWAKKHYDLILIDSRTGLADVAGICTMQLPDEVVLCFVLNRQNTEGVADIAASIRAARGNEVSIRLSPMRVSKDRPTEEADARARAQREMRNAGLNPERIEADMATLSIAAAPNIPFYETLAPFVATSASADPLTFEYLRMTQELVGSAFEAPKLAPGWVEAVRRRLQPRMTTIEYLTGLEGADPDRAFGEIGRFLDGALDADPSRELDADYVDALVETALDASDWLWSDTKDYPTLQLAEKALLLLRQLHSMGDGDWRLRLIDAMDQFDSRWSRGTIGSVLKGNIERDVVLAAGAQSTEILVRRAGLRVENARHRKPSSEYDMIERELAEGEALLESVHLPVQPAETESLALGHADIAARRAEVLTELGKHDESRVYWQRVIELLEAPVSTRGRSLKAEAHLGLAEFVPGVDAAAHVITAAQLWRASVTRNIDQFARATRIILADPDPEAKCIAFALAVFARSRSRAPRNVLGSSSPTFSETARYAQILEKLVVTMGGGPKQREALEGIADAAEYQLHRLTRFGSASSDKRPSTARRTMIEAYGLLCEALASAGAPDDVIMSLKQRIEVFRRRLRQSTLP